MIRVAAGYIPGHFSGITCWCRPRATFDEQGTLWVHRQVILRPDTQRRVFQSILTGPPV